MTCNHAWYVLLSTGWFGFQSDDGRQLLQQWSSAQEIVHSQPKPQWILAHHPVTCQRYVQRTEEHDSLYDQAVIPAGSVLSVVDTGRPGGGRKRSRFQTISRMLISSKKSNNKRGASYCLKCIDREGDELLLSATEPALFSRVCKLDALDQRCAYQLNDIMRRHQLPIVLKMALGEPPAARCHFTGVIKLEKLYFEECIVACILDNTDNPVMFEIPTNSGIEFVVANNSAKLMTERSIQSVLEYCHQTLDDYVVGMKVLHTFYSDGTTAVPVLDTSRPQSERSVLDTNRSQPERALPVSVLDTTRSQSERSLPVPVMDITRPQSERSLPPLPCVKSNELCVKSNEVCVSVTIPAQNSDSNLDKPREDSPYDTIRGLSRNANIVSVRTNCGHMSVAEAEEEDECGYLVPMRLSVLPELPNCHDPLAEFVPVRAFGTEQHCRRHSDQVARHTAPRLQSRLSAPCHPSSTVSDMTGMRTPHVCRQSDSGCSLTEIGDGDSARYSTERLDSFLADSVDELHRLRIFQHCSPSSTETVTCNASPRDDSEDDVSYLDTHQSINDFLDKIFEGAASSPPTGRGKLVSGGMSNTLFSDDNRCGGARKQLVHSATDSMLHLVARHSPSRRASYHDNPDRCSPLDIWDPPYAQIPACTTDQLFERRSLGARSSSRAADSGVELGIYSGGDLGELGGAYSGSSSDTDGIYRQAGDWVPPSDVSSLSVSQVAASLRYIGLRERLVTHFCEEQVDGKQLGELDDALLREGFPELNALERKKILDFISGWRPKKR